MKLGVGGYAAGLALVAVVSIADPAVAQKSGGTLRVYHRDSPASMSIHEEATNSVSIPMMAVFNNLVLYDQHATQNRLATLEAGLDALDTAAARTRRPWWRVVVSRVLPPVVALVVILAVWALLVALHVHSGQIMLPGPGDVWDSVRANWGPSRSSECNHLWLLKNSLPEKCSEKLCVRKPYKRRSRLG